MSLYIAEGSAGEYEDFHSWVIGVFTTRALAKRASASTVKPKVLAWHYNAKTQISTAFHKAAYSWDSIDFSITPIEVDSLYGV